MQNYLNNTFSDANSKRELTLTKELPLHLTEMSILKPKSMIRFYNLIAGRLQHKTLKSQCWAWGVTLMLLIVATTNSYTQCAQSNMACNDFVQVSLDDSCMVRVLPDMILEGALAADSFYRVTVWDGSLPLGDTLTDFYVNRRLEVSVRCLESGVSCWGYISLEDKKSPEVEVFPPMVMVDCDEAADNLTNPFAYVDSFFVDNGGCEKIDTLILMEETVNENGSCGVDGVIKTITRTFIATDKAGNIGSATQQIVVKKGELSDIEYPRDTVISCLDLPANGFDPAIFGEPTSEGCDIFKATHTDTHFPLCGGSFKVLRTWTVVDWCDGRDTTIQQILEALDTVPPVWNMNFETMEGSTYTGSQSCEGSITIPLEEYAAASDLCYALQPDDYKVTYKLGDTTTMSGFEDQIRTDVTVATNGDVTIDNLPLGTHMIVVTATDACGNSSTGSRLFTIRDNTPPNAICERITTAVLDFNGLGEMMAISLDDNSFDNCAIDRFEVKRLNSFCDGFEDDLMFGPSIHFCCEDIPNNPIKVVLRVYDMNDKASDCIVDVEVQDKRPVSLVCEPDVIVNCDFNFNNLEERLGTPTVLAEVCNLEDPVLEPFTPIVDDCGNGEFYVTWTVSDMNGVRDSCKQKVTVRNLSTPTITIPNNINVEGCDASQAHPKFIDSEPIIEEEDCEMTASSWTDEVDDTPNSGCIRITRQWVVIDWCTFDATDPSTFLRTGTQIVTLVDNEAPMIIECPEDFTVFAQPNQCEAMVSLPIRASDNCTLSDDLVYVYAIDLDNDGSIDVNGDTNDASENYQVGTHRISWTVTDRCGNVQNSCAYDFTVMTSDSLTVCDNTANISALIQGQLRDENNVKVPNVKISLKDRSTGNIVDINSDNNGQYQFSGLEGGRNYDINAELSGNDGLGISALDMLIIQRHILGLSSFNSPYQLLAADVNNSKSVSASDLVLLQKIILGFETTMTANDPWKFIPSDFTFDTNNPFDYPEIFSTGSLNGGVNGFDFIGLKVGDVDGNAFPALLNLSTDPRSRVNVMYDIGQVSENVYKVDFHLAQKMDITGFQLSIVADGISLSDRENGSVELSNNNIAVNDNQIKISWISSVPQSLGEENMFSFLLDGKQIESLELGKGLNAELYDDELNRYQITLKKEQDQVIKRSLEVFQNTPNPFEETTSISFMIPEKDMVTFKVYDMTGKVLVSKRATFDRGINQIELNKNELSSTGVLYYTIETSSDMKGQRMILLH